jgi:hypothetical protein
MVDHTTQFCPLQLFKSYIDDKSRNERSDKYGRPSFFMTVKKFATTLAEIKDAQEQTVLLLTFALVVVSGAIPK